MTDVSKQQNFLTNKNKIPIQKINWSNNDNEAFYQSISVEGLKEFAEKGGIASGSDLECLKSYWFTAQSILEVGAGYGRVIDYLIKHNFSGKITAIERCNASFEYLQQQFSHNSNVTLVQDDILNCDKVKMKFDLILFLWSGIADFSQQEQSLIIKKLAKLLNQGGHLVIDTMPPDVKSLSSTEVDKQLLYIKSDQSSAYGYIPTVDQIKDYGNEAKLLNSKVISFQTDIQRERLLIILS